MRQKSTSISLRMHITWDARQINNVGWKTHYVKSVQIRSFFWSVFSRIRTEYEEILISPYLVRMQENTDQKKLRIWTLSTQCRLPETCRTLKKKLLKYNTTDNKYITETIALYYSDSVLTHFSLLLHFIWKLVVCFARQNKRLVSIWNATLCSNGLKN